MKTQTAIFLLSSLFNLNLYGQTGFVAGEPELAYWEIGNKSHTVIVLHGGPCVEHNYLRPEFDRLIKHCKVIYYDQRGCGKSSPSNSYQWEDHVLDLHRLIRSLVPSQKVFLAGSSWGSLLALLYAYKYQEDVEGLVLSGLVHWGGEGLDNEAYQIFTTGRGYQPDRIDTIYLKPDLEKKYSPRRAIWYTGRRSTEPRVSFSKAPVLDSLKRIKIPILIFTEDSTCTYNEAIEHYVKTLPNSMTYKISGSCHDTWFSEPNLFFRKSNKFIKKIIKNYNTLTDANNVHTP